MDLRNFGLCVNSKEKEGQCVVPNCGDESPSECDVEVVVEMCGMSERRLLKKVMFFTFF